MITSKYSVDPLIKKICERCAKLSHRALFVLRGEEDISQQVVVLHHLLQQSTGTNHSVLWCHKKDAQLPKSSRKSLKKLASKLQSGKVLLEDLQPLDLLLQGAAVRFCSYSDTHTILGTTYGMCVLQDVECLTPNVLCRVVETVSGGGAVVLLLHGLSSVQQLVDLDMTVHRRLTTHAHTTPTKLFNARLVSSLAWCETCVILDASLRVCDDVPNMASSRAAAATLKAGSTGQEEAAAALRRLQEQLSDAPAPLPQLIALCKTLDQANAVVKLIDVVTERRGTGGGGGGEVVAVTAGRGRGKSAALGLAVAAAVHLGINNVFVTSPSPHNLASFFQLLFEGLDALDYEEGKDYEILQSTNPEFAGAIIRVNFFRGHRQTIQYVLPHDHEKVQQAEIVVVDEAAAIPLTHVQALLGSHVTLMASTISGYEGTGRSLSLKLLKQLRSRADPSAAAATAVVQANHAGDAVGKLHEVTLERSIRYGEKDPVERWLYRLLCLHATEAVAPAISCPAPASCCLYYVNKSVLLSGSKGSEAFLLQAISLLVSSHYRNSPDDLQILADAPAHHLFVLLPPLPSDNLKHLPSVLAVMQVCLEGGIPVSVSRGVMRRGERPAGDVVPWMLATQFLQPELTQHCGARIIRVATHPQYQGMGYGSRAVEQLRAYYSGALLNLSGSGDSGGGGESSTKGAQALLSCLSDRVPEPVEYLSVSYGMTPRLYKFWATQSFIPLYVGQAVNKTTGEHNCMMVCSTDGSRTTPSVKTEPAVQTEPAATSLPPWLATPAAEFLRRFISLLGGALSHLHPSLAHNIVSSHADRAPTEQAVTWKEVSCWLSGHDLRRLQQYSRNLVDRHLITDLIPAIAKLYYSRRLPPLQLSHVQACLLVGCGLQNQEVVSVGAQLGMNAASTLGNFNRAVRRIYTALAALQEAVFADKLALAVPDLLVPVNITLEQDLERISKETEEERPDYHFKKRKQVNDFALNLKSTKKKKKNKYSCPL